MSTSLGETVGSGQIVVVGAHIQGLFMKVHTVPREGESVLGDAFQEPVDGGKATNQAVCAARLGAPVRFVTVLGNDDRGQRWRTLLEDEGIVMRWTITTDKPTDIGFVMLPPSGIPAIVTALEANLELNTTTIEQLADAFAGASIVICQLEASQEAALAAFRMAKQAGALTILNPSPAAKLTKGLLELTDILIPNEHEAAWLLQASGTPDQLARKLQRACKDCCIIVTAGEQGAYICDRHGSTAHIPTPKVAVVDTTGAGDAFVGALAVRLRAGDELEDAVQFAVRTASLTVTREGTIPSYFFGR